MSRQKLKKLFVALTLAAVSLRPERLEAWGESGHSIVGRIAENLLSDRAKAAIRELLPGQSIADVQVSSWADLIKHSSFYDKRYPNNGAFHFVDIPFDAQSYDPARDCMSGNCVVAQITHFQTVLADPNASQRDCKEALMYLDHLVGDIAQPLHAAQRNDDHGANLVLVTFPGGADGKVIHTNLHHVWDVELVAALLGKQTPLAYADQAAAALTPEEKQDWAQGTPADWAWESHQLAVNDAYRYADGRFLPLSGEVNLDASYVNKNTPIVRQQLAKAGVRLAKVLNEALSAPATPTTQR